MKVKVMKAMTLSDCERLCWENSERRKFAEEYDDRENLRKQEAWDRQMRCKELKKWRRWGRVAKITGQVHLVVGVVLAMLGMPVWAFMSFAGAIFYHLCVKMFVMMEADYV